MTMINYGTRKHKNKFDLVIIGAGDPRNDIYAEAKSERLLKKLSVLFGIIEKEINIDNTKQTENELYLRNLLLNLYLKYCIYNAPKTQYIDKKSFIEETCRLYDSACEIIHEFEEYDKVAAERCNEIQDKINNGEITPTEAITALKKEQKQKDEKGYELYDANDAQVLALSQPPGSAEPT